MQTPSHLRLELGATRKMGCKIGFGALLILLSSAALAEERTIDKKFPASANGTLTLQTDTGSVVVIGSDADEVSVHVALKGSRSALDKFEVTTASDANGVNVQGHRTAAIRSEWPWFFGEDLRVNYSIQIPRNYRVQIATSGGDMDLRNFNGTTSATTSGGNIKLSALNGDLQTRTSGGDIRAAQIVGVAEMRTSGGSVTVENARGEISARTSGGDMRLRGIDGKLYAHTSGGNIDVDLVGANRGVDVGTSGGNITLNVPKEFAAAVNAHTSGGDVDCDLPATVAGRQDRSKLKGDINGGGQPLIARSSGGNISIRAKH